MEKRYEIDNCEYCEEPRVLIIHLNDPNYKHPPRIKDECRCEDIRADLMWNGDE